MPGNFKLMFFPTAEGYVSAVYPEGITGGDPPKFAYVTNIRDHLGNLRMSITRDNNDKVILQERNYYPFGLLHQGYNEEKHEIKYTEAEEDKIFTPQVVAGHYKYWYNGKEWQEDLGLDVYDYGARQYDPAVGRWFTVDPLGEEFPEGSGYAYTYDNPIRFVDLDGKKGVDNFIFDKNGNLIERIENNQPDKFFIRENVTEIVKVENLDGSISNMSINYEVNIEINFNSDLGYMARTIYAEAAGQNKTSKLAIAEVIRNRANDKTKPSKDNNYMAQFSDVNTFEEVVNQPGQFETVSNNVPRYSDPLRMTGGDGIHKRNELETKSLADSFGAAIKATYQQTNITQGSTYFVTPGRNGKLPSWTTGLQEVKIEGIDTNKFRFFRY